MQQSEMSTKPSYEDLMPKVEPKETRESHLLLVHIPDGFAREHIGAKVEFDYGRVRIFGERPLQNNTIKRFNVVRPVPPTCDINRIKGKFEGGIVTITMPKKVISEVVPDQRPQPTEKEAPKTPVQETEPSPDKEPEEVPPQSTTEEAQEETTAAAAEVEGQKDKEGISDQEAKSTIQDKDKADSETSTVPEGVPQKTTSGDAKLQREEKLTGTTTDGKEEKPREEETKEDVGKTLEQGKQPEKAVVDDSPTNVKETEKERKVSSADVAESTSVPKTAEKDEDKVIPEYSTAKRIKEMAASASQAVTRLAKRFDEEEKRKLIYMGAAVVVVALGVYASYKFRTSLRK